MQITFSFVVAIVCFPLVARAEIIQAPFGGQPIGLGDARVACGTPGGGWIVERSGHAVRPPASDDEIGEAVELKLATDVAACASTRAVITLVTTGRWPVFDPASVVFAADEGRFDARGRQLRGVAIARQGPGGIVSDVCPDPRLEANAEHCTWAVGPGLASDPGGVAFTWVPAGGRVGPEVRTFDVNGRNAPPETFALTPARTVINALVAPDTVIDLSAGRGIVPLLHPQAVTSVDCGTLPCELAAGKVVVRGVSSSVNSVDAKFRLAPHFSLVKKSGVEAEPVVHIPVLHCPMSIVSGAPIRGVDRGKVVLRIEGRCSHDLGALRFLANSAGATLVRTHPEDGAAYAVVQIGNIDTSTVTVTGVRADDPTITVAEARSDTQPAPEVHATLELPDHPHTNFIPNNRDVIVHTTPLPGPARLVVVPIEGVYSVHQSGGLTAVRGDPTAAGLTSLRFGYRVDTLPGPLAQIDLAILTDPLQRSIHEANIPVPIGPSALGPEPLIEFVCADDAHLPHRIMPGDTAHLPFEARDSCRLVFHRERLSPENGTQKLSLDVEVLNSDGNGRAEGHVSQVVVLRAGDEPRLAWIHGVKAPFDRVVIRISQAADEAHYVDALEIATGAPDIKWTAVLGTGHARLYATTAIPTGLYRFGDAAHSGVVSLNFGIVSRLTWLDQDGHEGLLGLEGGIMAIGLTNDKSQTGESLTQIGLVGGIGFSVPIANRSSPTQASINLHGWVEEDISNHSSPNPGSRMAIIFGPSISIGNVGANL